MPLQVKPQILPTKNGGKFDITVLPRSTDGKPIEKVAISLPMPKSTTSVSATCNVGNYMYDPVTKVTRKISVPPVPVLTILLFATP